MSQNVLKPTLTSSSEAAASAVSRNTQIDLRAVLVSPLGVAAMLTTLGLALAYWPLLSQLPSLWFGDDTYYAHGAVIPICVGLIVWDRYPLIVRTPVKGAAWAFIPLAIVLYVTWFAWPAGMYSLASMLFLAAILCAVWILAGFRMTKLLVAPTLYLIFALPVFGKFIDKYTQPLQDLSTTCAFQLLRLGNFHPLRDGSNLIYLDKYTLDIAVPCSGLKMLLAVAAIVSFFLLVAHLKWFANAILLASAIPLALLVNGVRIALVGVVGDTFGAAAGHSFHDWSGYISLLLCFLCLMWLTKALGWKSS